MSVDNLLLEVWLHFLLYDDLPLLAKWVEVQGEGLDVAIATVEVWRHQSSCRSHRLLRS